MNYGQVQTPSEVQDSHGFCSSNYGMGQNGISPIFFGPEFGNQGFRYQMENLQMLISSGYFMGQMGSMNQ